VPNVYVHDTQKAGALERAFTQELDGQLDLPPAERQLAIGWLREAMSGLVVGNKPLLTRESAITVVELPQRREQTLHEFSGITDLEGARNLARRQVADLVTLPPSVRMDLADMLASFLDVKPLGGRRGDRRAARAGGTRRSCRCSCASPRARSS
jgi:hypothetical protein